MKTRKTFKLIRGFILLLTTLIFISISTACQDNQVEETGDETRDVVDSKEEVATSDIEIGDTETSEDILLNEPDLLEDESNLENKETPESEEQKDITTNDITADNQAIEYNGNLYTIIKVDGGNLSGYREANVAVDIGYGDREYWTFTNEYGQLIYVIADKIVLQDDSSEPVNSNGRYYDDEAKVPGVESDSLDEGHVIADSLGGVSNAYNITPQDSTLNRHGDQAYMEKVIRDAGGCEKFVATITYPDTTTQIPSHYHYEYILNGEGIVDDFDNINPDEVNWAMESQVTESATTENTASEEPAPTVNNDLSSVDTNGNGEVTIKEAKAAGYSMPIHSDHWLYQYMDDRDGDGMVGE